MKRGWLWGAACTWLATAGLASAVPVTDFAVYAKGNVAVQDTVMGDVGSQTGSVQVKGKKVVVQGDVSAGSSVQVSSGAAVRGDVSAGGAITTSSKGVITGITQPNLSITSLAPAIAGDLLPVHTFTAGGTSYTGTQKTLTLDPGSYGNVGGKKAATLYLGSGDYYLSSLSSKGGKIMLDLSQGAINLYVTGNMSLNKSTVFVKGATGDYVAYSKADPTLAGLVYAEVEGKATLSSAQWLGTLFTPKSTLQASSASVTGALYSGMNILLKGKGQTIRYAPLASPPIQQYRGPGVRPAGGRIRRRGPGGRRLRGRRRPGHRRFGRPEPGGRADPGCRRHVRRHRRSPGAVYTGASRQRLARTGGAPAQARQAFGIASRELWLGLGHEHQEGDSSMNRLISLGFLAAGVLLLVFGISASKSLGSDISRFFTGSPTDKAIWMLIGGVVLSMIGLVGLLRGSRSD